MQITRHVDEVEVATEWLRFFFDSDLRAHVEIRSGEGWETPCANPSGNTERRPFHCAILNGKQVAAFRLDETADCCNTPAFSDFGSGTAVTLRAIDSSSLASPVTLSLTLTIYSAFPRVAFIRSCFDFGDLQGSGGSVDVLLNQLLLDAGNLGGETPYDLWVYNGSAELREHCLQALTPDYFKRNYLGVLESHDGGGYQPGYRHGTQPGFGGGTPLVDLWGPRLGLAIGHIEPSFRPCSLPVRVDSQGFVGVALLDHQRVPVDGLLKVASLESFLFLHQGDFFESLDLYRRMRQARGVGFPPHPVGAYEPVWDTWGFREDFTPEDVVATVPHLKEMGICWITLDDRWFDATGDWLPRRDRFPGGEVDFAKFIERLHEEGMKVKLWTIPGEADAESDPDHWLGEHPSAIVEVSKHSHHCRSRFAEDHPNWFVLDPREEPEVSKRGNLFCCGSIREVREHFREVTEKMFRDWKIDGLKQDAVYICPACYAVDHQHSSPDEASRDYSEILRTVFETALQVNPDAVIVNCPCGTTLTPDWMRWQNQALAPDPWTSWVNRGIVKQLKALFGASSAVVLDHIELSDEGCDFSLIGVGGIPATRITPDGREKSYGIGAQMTFAEKKLLWKRWIELYRRFDLARGEYLNLYDFVYDVPETHVIRRKDSLFFSFYAGEPDGIVADERQLYEMKKATKRFRGRVEFRGLDRGLDYQVTDYEREMELAIVSGCNPHLEIAFEHHLLLKLTPIK